MPGPYQTTAFACRSAEKQYANPAEHCVIDSVTGSPIDSQLAQTLAQRLAIAEIPGGKPVDSRRDLGLRAGVRELRKPNIKDVFSSTRDVVADLDHGFHCNL